MKTIVKHKEKVVRLMEGGIYSDENRLDDLYVYDVINDARAATLREDFLKYRRWSPSALQTFYPDYDVNFQESTVYTTFRIPTGFIQASSLADGLVYFGSDGKCIYDSQNFDRIKNRAELNDFLNNSRTNDFSIPAILIEGLTVTVLSKENVVQNLQVVGVFDDPTAFSNYNINKDLYPISQDLSVRMYEIVEKGTMLRVFSRPADEISNSAAPQTNIRR